MLLHVFTEVLLMPTLTVEPSGRQVYTEDTVSLACQLPGLSGLGWQFYWHKDRCDLQLPLYVASLMVYNGGREV